MRERSIQAPRVSADDTNTHLQQMERCLPAHTATGVPVLGLAVARRGRRILQHDIQRLYRVTDATQLLVDILCRSNVTIREATEIEQNPGSKAPIQRHLIDRARRLSARRESVIHRGVIM